MAFWVYMLQCSDGMIYTGHTEDLERRLQQHSYGGFCAFTEKRRPVKLIYATDFPSRAEALAAELQIKGWSRKKKLALARQDWAALKEAARTSRPKTS